MTRRPPRSTLFSLHDALPISGRRDLRPARRRREQQQPERHGPDKISRGRGQRVAERAAAQRIHAGNFVWAVPLDRKSTRLNSSHQIISYAVFCLKKKKNKWIRTFTSIPYYSDLATYRISHTCVHYG